MSMTPAFSPGPWITHGALVGSVRKWIFEDLYEQCSFHIAEKMPSSVKLGGRPISLTSRSYSSGLSPCCAINSGVMAGSLEITGEARFTCLSHMEAAKSRRQLEVIHKAGEQAAAVGPAHDAFDVIFRMRHHAKHIAALIDDAGDGVHGAVVVPVWVDHAVRRRIAENHPALAFQPGDGLAVGNIIALAVRYRNADHLAGIVAAGERRVGALDPQIDVAADEAKLRVAHQHARQQPSLAGDLKAVANRQHEAAFLRKGAHRVHDRGARRDCSAAQIVAIREAAWNNGEIGPGRQRGIGVPYHRRLVPGDQLEGARHVALAIDAGKHDDGRFYSVTSIR